MRCTIIALVALFTVACAPMNGVLSVNIKDGNNPPLHELYAVMRDNGFLMKKPQSLETYPEEHWDTSKGTATGAFVDPTFTNLVAVAMQFKDDQTLWIFFDESPLGFSSEGQARTDKTVAALKARFGDKINITERRNYKGAH